MHHQHHQPTGEGLANADQLLDRLQTRMRHINTMARWAEQWAVEVAGLREEMAGMSAELTLAQDELTFWRRSKARELLIDPDELPPSHYLKALRAPQSEPHRPVAVEIDGDQWLIGLRRDRSTVVDPIVEMRDWQRSVDIAREVAEEDM
ncbi:hypothetical protein [Nonomuraea sp. NPDC049750]|uniref:hypothetical protein n=1 Tax=Nonomuraea sp. NPDC049750 TaxID=3154738 RepID=UPI0033CFFBC1